MDNLIFTFISSGDNKSCSKKNSSWKITPNWFHNLQRNWNWWLFCRLFQINWGNRNFWILHKLSRSFWSFFPDKRILHYYSCYILAKYRSWIPFANIFSRKNQFRRNKDLISTRVHCGNYLPIQRFKLSFNSQGLLVSYGCLYSAFSVIELRTLFKRGGTKNASFLNFNSTEVIETSSSYIR